MKSRKIARAQESFRREISDIVFSMKDPRIQKGFLTVSGVDLSNDCVFCKVYISCIEGLGVAKKTCKALNHAAGFIQSSVASRLKLRIAPKILFLPDNSEEYAFKMGNIIEKINQEGKSNLDEISCFLENNDNFAIYTHVLPDGDAVGSCCALCLALKRIGKRAKVVFDDEFPDRLKFLVDIIKNSEDFIPETFICLDVCEKNRIGKFENQIFNVCIDHHDNSSCSFNKLVYIDSRASSCAEIVYRLLTKMGVNIDSKIAIFIYVGISSDTGNFRYSNVNSNIFVIMSEIFDKIENFSIINHRLSGGFSREFIKFQGEIISKFEYFGSSCIAFISLEDINKYGIEYSSLSAFSNMPLQISGIKLGVVVKQKSENNFKVSARSINDGIALRFCKLFSGGGHSNAAGFEISGDVDFVKNAIIRAIKDNF